MKKLVKCPNCELNGKSQVLGEINENGDFVVLRFHKGSTIISGENLKVTCGGCGEVVYRKEVQNEQNRSIGIPWIHRQTFMQVVGTL